MEDIIINLVRKEKLVRKEGLPIEDEIILEGNNLSELKRSIFSLRKFVNTNSLIAIITAPKREKLCWSHLKVFRG